MPQLENKEILVRILRSTIGVIGRRTSEAYATVILNKAIRELAEKHSFLQYVEVKGTQYTETFDMVVIQSDINHVESEKIGKATNEFIEKITKLMGKNAGYYFIKEIKEDLPFGYEKIIKEMGVDLDLLQLEFITGIKNTFKFQITNSDVLKHIIKTLFDILDGEIGREYAITAISELTKRFSTKYTLLKYVKINDIRYIQNVDLVIVMPEVDAIEPTNVGTAIQKIVQEVNYLLGEKGGYNFIEKLRNNLTSGYIFKLGEMGVNINVLQLSQVLIVQHVLKALIDVLSELSTQSYAILTIDNVIRKLGDEYEFLKYIKIDSMRYSEGVDAVSVPSDINSVRSSEVGRGIQKIVENIASSLGEDADRHFIEKFKRRLGKAYVLRIEELGVNLHMIELRRNLAW